MGKKLNKVFVVDLEATCWETKQEQGDKPNEIIEIGVTVIDTKTWVPLETVGYVVKPRFTTVSAFCQNLTGWTDAEVQAGGDLFQTIDAIVADHGWTKDHIWFSCGEYDARMLSSRTLSRLYGQIKPTIFDLSKHVNIKTLFALKQGLTKEVGLDSMLRMIGETLDGRHHNGADDSRNIAKIVKHVLKG